MNGKVGSFSRNEERARTAGHDPVILAGVMKVSNGVYPTGLLLTRNVSSEMIPLEIVADETVATGNGSTKNFTAIVLESFPVEPGTVSASDGVETFADDGSGRLSGSAGGSGTINYKTGKMTLSFNANVVNATPVTAGYITAINGVLDEETDTAQSGSGAYVAHGTVDSNVLKVGTVNPVAPSSVLMMLLQSHGIYPV